ncbi:MAG: hypothetical protein WC179_06145 [Candidatus Cloacimonadaceae bacterium]
MKLLDLYNRIVETTGLDIVTIDSLKTAIANCMADLTSRGYRVFKEIKLSDTEGEFTFTRKYEDNRMIVLNLPTDIRKIIYCKTFFPFRADTAKRLSLSNNRVQASYIDGQFRTVLSNFPAIYYVKGDQLVIEWDVRFGAIQDVIFGYYARLIAPEFNTNVDDVNELKSVDIPIREEFEDALVFYAAYFYYSRFIKDVEKIQLYLNNYKYYVEDITHELAYEDEFFEEDSIIHEEE